MTVRRIISGVSEPVLAGTFANQAGGSLDGWRRWRESPDTGLDTRAVLPHRLAAQECQQVLNFGGGEPLLVVVRHQRVLVKLDLAQVQLQKPVEMALRIENLDGVVSVIAGYAGDFFAGLSDYGDAAVSFGDVRIGIEQRFAQLPKGDRARDIGEVGSEKTAAAADHVAVRAAGLAVEQGASGLNIAG